IGAGRLAAPRFPSLSGASGCSDAKQAFPARRICRAFFWCGLGWPARALKLPPCSGSKPFTSSSWPAGLLGFFFFPAPFSILGWGGRGVAPGSAAERDRLLLMARKLLRFTTLLAVPALALGLWLWMGYGIGWGPGNG